MIRRRNFDVARRLRAGLSGRLRRRLDGRFGCWLFGWLLLGCLLLFSCLLLGHRLARRLIFVWHDTLPYWLSETQNPAEGSSVRRGFSTRRRQPKEAYSTSPEPFMMADQLVVVGSLSDV